MYAKDHLDKKNSLNDSKKENLMLKYEIESKNRQLTTKILELTEKETIIADIIHKLSQLDQDDVDKCKIHNLVSSLKSGQIFHNWQEFEVCFDLTHPNFYNSIDARFPMLTANDKKLCAFLKLHFSTKEIAIITGKSINTIDVGRSRLRKKMGMSSDENLQSFIAHLN
jgi:DNA-binding CsgD family transcriptional regulator